MRRTHILVTFWLLSYTGTVLTEQHHTHTYGKRHELTVATLLLRTSRNGRRHPPSVHLSFFAVRVIRLSRTLSGETALN